MRNPLLDAWRKRHHGMPSRLPCPACPSTRAAPRRYRIDRVAPGRMGSIVVTFLGTCPQCGHREGPRPPPRDRTGQILPAAVTLLLFSFGLLVLWPLLCEGAP